MREERVKMRLRAQMEDLCVMCMVHVREDTEELAVNVLYGGGKGVWKILT